MVSNIIDFAAAKAAVTRVKKGESRLIYIAAPFSAREEARQLKDLLEAAGHVITSTWITSHLSDMTAPVEQLAHEANHDAEGVGRCEILILLNNVGASTTGGMHVEFGLAIAWGKSILIVGDKTNIFHHIESPNMKQVDSISDVADRINRYFPRKEAK